MTEVQLTHVGGPTVLIEVEGKRLLTGDTVLYDEVRKVRSGCGSGSPSSSRSDQRRTSSSASRGCREAPAGALAPFAGWRARN
jgi:hypothetical protein